MRASGWGRLRAACRLGGSAVLLLGAAGIGLACGSSDGTGPAAGGNESAGKRIAAQRGCAGCHSSNGRPGVGPTWQGLFGTEEELSDGSTVTVDEAYVERSIREPSAQIVDGFSVQMPRIDVSDEEVVSLVEYIRSLA